VFLLADSKEKSQNQVAALKYSPDVNAAPTILALGKGDVAKKILEKAKEHQVPLYRDPNLASVLNSLRIGDEIPPELYEIVASILIFVSGLDKKYGQEQKNEY
jgi:flagellar biosynthesis protein